MTLAKKSDSGQNICEEIKKEGIYIASSNVLVKGNYIDLLNHSVSVVISWGELYRFARFLMIPSTRIAKMAPPDELCSR